MTPINEAREREAFERWFGSTRRSKGVEYRVVMFARRTDDGTYVEDHTQRHWWTWQNARAALPAAEESQGEDKWLAAQRSLGPITDAEIHAMQMGYFGGPTLAELAERIPKDIPEVSGRVTRRAPAAAEPATTKPNENNGLAATMPATPAAQAQRLTDAEISRMWSVMPKHHSIVEFGRAIEARAPAPCCMQPETCDRSCVNRGGWLAIHRPWFFAGADWMRRAPAPADPSADLVKAARKVIRDRDTFGWSREADDAIEALRFALPGGER